MFITNMPENANDLVNWAWSHLPKKMGTRGTRKKKRMSLKWARKRLRDKTIKEQKKEAVKRKEAKKKRIQAEVDAMYEEAARIREAAKQNRMS